MTLVWDIDLTDTTIPSFVVETFQPVTKLPLYFCFRCASSSYLLKSNDTIKAFPPPGNDESPYEDFPLELARRPFELHQIPSEIDALLTLEDTIGFDQLDEAAVNRLAQFYSRPVTSAWDLPFSQFGGQPLLYQGHQKFECPNPVCPASKLQYPYENYVVDLLMKELGVVTGDAADELAATSTQIAYHICPICTTIRADYRCA